jgi:hypothetical protein
MYRLAFAVETIGRFISLSSAAVWAACRATVTFTHYGAASDKCYLAALNKLPDDVMRTA